MVKEWINDEIEKTSSNKSTKYMFINMMLISTGKLMPIETARRKIKLRNKDFGKVEPRVAKNKGIKDININRGREKTWFGSEISVPAAPSERLIHVRFF